jgi:hypothetical protein
MSVWIFHALTKKQQRPGGTPVHGTAIQVPVEHAPSVRVRRGYHAVRRISVAAGAGAIDHSPAGHSNLVFKSCERLKFGEMERSFASPVIRRRPCSE